MRRGFPGGSVVKNPPANAGDADLIPGLGRSPGGENDNRLLGNPMDRTGAWRLLYCLWHCKGVRHELATKQDQQEKFFYFIFGTIHLQNLKLIIFKITCFALLTFTICRGIVLISSFTFLKRVFL